MKMALSVQALRVIGCLLEKQVTTPDQYPLSLNGVVTACNQKSNREPVMNLSESEVQSQLDELVKKHLVTSNSGFGQRVSKYEQRFCNSAFGNLQLSSAEVAVLTLLFLRGAQTPGELRTRSGRLHEFSDMNEVEQTLNGLISREDGPMVVRLAREPGKRESRYMHLFGGDVVDVPATTTAEDNADLEERVAQLEETVARLQAQLEQLLQQEH
ncbi:DUF480 domain-containing protein [Pantoea phytobeneficialis]|uniref:DUF480 domain-containing protein n=1 Tax=Pantoea phytobeneficialis TaxID=2052056 RepID=A0AAP9KNZ8_9GAMM|nr:DUF480 domain-containing protein [Pantoea phytobeneficialis]MDO6409632.1 DUF480 domain-containing protein [Pantoea phytobeneficialis]QGR06312.1 hypothetical protein CTZ24_07795 [Pantoea phytobeneficialis]